MKGHRKYPTFLNIHKVVNRLLFNPSLRLPVLLLQLQATPLLIRLAQLFLIILKLVPKLLFNPNPHLSVLLFLITLVRHVFKNIFKMNQKHLSLKSEVNI